MNRIGEISSAIQSLEMIYRKWGEEQFDDIRVVSLQQEDFSVSLELDKRSSTVAKLNRLGIKTLWRDCSYTFFPKQDPSEGLFYARCTIKDVLFEEADLFAQTITNLGIGVVIRACNVRSSGSCRTTELVCSTSDFVRHLAEERGVKIKRGDKYYLFERCADMRIETYQYSRHLVLADRAVTEQQLRLARTELDDSCLKLLTETFPRIYMS